MTNAIAIGLKEYGVKEIRGENNNPRILQYSKETGMDFMRTDEDAWCSAYANWVAKEAGLEYTKKANARSWLQIGDAILYPQIGDVVVLWRESPESWKGHVGFYINDDVHNIYVLGGNQSNMVNIQAYPKSKVLGYRRLSKA